MIAPRKDSESDINERIIEALGQVRVDLYRPIRYLFFVFFAGIARGIGFALGMTVVLALLVFLVTKVLTAMVDFPLVGKYIKEILVLVQTYLKTGVRIK
ncbi:DUF5665 domain-containing protein [Candidatus Margulisiibacteriota bacterium]